MHYKKIDNTTYILRLVQGEEMIGSLKKFCGENNIKAGYFNGLGAVSEVSLAHYTVENKKYTEANSTEPLEIASLFGIITSDKLHAHGVFADNECKSYCGHVVKAIISATCEIILHAFDTSISRYADKKIGLDLLVLEDEM